MSHFTQFLVFFLTVYQFYLGTLPTSHVFCHYKEIHRRRTDKLLSMVLIHFGSAR